MTRLRVNGVVHEVDVDPDMPLLWVLRDELGLTGTKFGCGIGACGACTVLVDGVARAACSVRVGSLTSPPTDVTTIEGADGSDVAPVVQEEWIRAQVAQCGYCQPGQVLAATALLGRRPEPTAADIDAALSGNLCRCGTYGRIRQAIHAAAARLKT